MSADGHDGGGRIVLCADDYAMTEGVSRSIDRLAADGRLSAVSVMVTGRHWPALGERARAMRSRCAVGLHLDLTLGAPLGPMPRLAPAGRLPAIGELTARALRGDIDRDEVAAEVRRQLAAFSDAIGHPPDHVDGHQHAHALPVVRDAVLATLAGMTTTPKPLVRDPADRPAAILRRRTAVAKALALAWLSRGFGAAARRAGFPTNDSFAGVSSFAPGAAAAELRRAAHSGGRLHMVMCHPGYPDAELAAIDPVVARRRIEHDLLLTGAALGRPIWRPVRDADGGAIDWRSALGAGSS